MEHRRTGLRAPALGGKRAPIGVEGSLRIKLGTLFDDAVLETSVAKQNAGEPYYGIPDEVARWIRDYGHPPNFFAQCLFHRARYSAPFPDDASPWLADALARFLAKLDSMPALNGATPLRHFWIRASGLTRDGLGIEWNPSTRRFENLPWTLPALLAEEPPPGAIRVGAEEGTLQRLRPVLDAARALKLDVRENRAATRHDTGNRWSRTLEVRARAATRSDSTCLLSVWEHAGDPEFYLAPEVAEDQIPQPLRTVMTALGNPPKAAWIDEREIVS